MGTNASDEQRALGRRQLLKATAAAVAAAGIPAKATIGAEARRGLLGPRLGNPIAVSTYSFWRFQDNAKLPIETCIRLAGEMGFDAVFVSGCHEGERPKANLDLSAEDLRPALLDVPSRQIKEILLIDSKDPGRSYMLMKVAGGEGIKGRKMPVGNVPGLSADEISLFADWVRSFGKGK